MTNRDIPCSKLVAKFLCSILSDLGLSHIFAIPVQQSARKLKKHFSSFKNGLRL